MPTKEEQQLKIEENRRLREKQMLQLKASNEMLEQAKQKVIERYGEGSDASNSYLKLIDTAQSDNLKEAQNYLNANQIELDSLDYHLPNPKEVEAYNARLKRLNKTDDDVRRKNIAETKKVSKSENVLEKTKSKISNLITKIKSNKTDSTDQSVAIANNAKKEDNKEEIKITHNIKHADVKDKGVLTPIEESYYMDFDPRSVPDYVQYDMIPLPSKGECYKHKKGKIPIAYLTAADENLIMSRNLYESGSMIDIILERKILDKSIRVSDLCKGDRDAIAIWLRATAYGPDYPIIAYHEEKEIETKINLSEIEYLPFNLKGDENGWFDFTTSKGDVLKFKILTQGEELEIFNKNKTVSEIVNRGGIVENMDKTINLIKLCENNDKEDILEAVKLIKEWALKFDGNKAEEELNKHVHMTYLTDRMVAQTMAVNGNTDREYIRLYIENMIAKDAFTYRKYMSDNVPGVNLEITIPIPESQGGGSFTTFLSIGDTIFANI